MYNKDDEVEVTAKTGQANFYRGEHGKVHAHIPKTGFYMVRLNNRIGCVFMRCDALKLLKRASHASAASGQKKGASGQKKGASGKKKK